MHLPRPRVSEGGCSAAKPTESAETSIQETALLFQISHPVLHLTNWLIIFCSLTRYPDERLFSGSFLGLNKFIFFVNYFYSQNKLLMLMTMFS